MKVKNCLFMILIIPLLFTIACAGALEFLTPTPLPTSIKTPAPVPVPTATPLPADTPVLTPRSTPNIPATPFVPTPTPQRELEFFSEIANLLPAYADKDNDLSFTPYEILKTISGEDYESPKLLVIKPAMFDLAGNLLVEFGGGPVLLAGDVAVTSSVVDIVYSPRLDRIFSQEELSEFFPPSAGYELLSEQEKVNTLLDLIADAMKKNSLPPEFDSLPPREQVEAMLVLFADEVGQNFSPSGFHALPYGEQLETMNKALLGKIWNSWFPPVPVGTIPLKLQIRVLEGEYAQNKAVREMIIVFGELEDGSPDYEVLEKSIVEDRNLVLEIFQRNPNPSHPFPAFLPFEIQELGDAGNPEFKPRYPLIFYGYGKGFNDEYVQITKRASVASIDYDRSIIAMNGSVTLGDAGALVFSLKCGMGKLVGITLGSQQKIGKEKEASVLGIRGVIKFIEDNTDITIQTRESMNLCPEADPIAKARLEAAVSDGRYDSAYDLCDLKNCDTSEIMPWIRPFQSVVIYKDNPDEARIVSDGFALLLPGGDVVVLTSSISPTTLSGAAEEMGEYSRILWGAADDYVGGEQKRYEYLEFVGVDETRRVALFKRQDSSSYPAPYGTLPTIGKSGELKVRNVLYTVGAADFQLFVDYKTFEEGSSSVLRQANDPAYIVSFLPENENIFYIESSGREEDIGSVIFALRDGDLELVGFLYSLMKDADFEALNVALTIDFVLDAVEEIKCKEGLSSCEKLRAGEQDALRPYTRTYQAEHDRSQITSLLTANTPYFSSLLIDMLGIDTAVISQHEGRIAIGTFLVGKEGKILDEGPVIFGEALLLPDGHVITPSSFFEFTASFTKSGFSQDKTDITSNTLATIGSKKLEVRIGLLRDEVLLDSEVSELFRDIPLVLAALDKFSNPYQFLMMSEDEKRSFVRDLQNIFSRHGEHELAREIHKIVDNPLYARKLLGREDLRQFIAELINEIEILEIVLVDRENGFALLKRPTSQAHGESLRIMIQDEIKNGQEILLSYSREIPMGERISLISPGTIIYANPSHHIFALGGFVSGESLGVRIYGNCAGQVCLIGILSKTHSRVDKIQTEGAGLSIDFIFEKIKQKTGIDLYPKSIYSQSDEE